MVVFFFCWFTNNSERRQIRTQGRCEQSHCNHINSNNNHNMCTWEDRKRENMVRLQGAFLAISHTFKILLYFAVCPHGLPSFTHPFLPLSVSLALSRLPSGEAGSPDPVWKSVTRIPAQSTARWESWAAMRHEVTNRTEPLLGAKVGGKTVGVYRPRKI